MSLLWRVASSLADEEFYGQPDHPNYFDHRPYSDRLTRHLIKTKGQGGADNICMCEHIEHVTRSHVNEGLHPLYSAEAEGDYSHPWVGPICNDCATGHMSDQGIHSTPKPA